MYTTRLSGLFLYFERMETDNLIIALLAWTYFKLLGVIRYVFTVFGDGQGCVCGMARFVLGFVERNVKKGQGRQGERSSPGRESWM